MTSDAPRPSVRPGPLRRATRPGVPAGVAPGVDPAWAETFLLELRLADVPGRHIGDALAEVASHCAESGESAREAFGDPVEYARSLALPSGAAPAPALGSLAAWVAQTLGLLLLTTSVPALVAGELVAVTTGHLVAAVLLVVALEALARWGTALLRFLVERPVLSWLALMAHFGLLVAALLLLDGVVGRVGAPVAVAVGAVALLAGTVGVVATLRREGVADDPVTAPFVLPPRPHTALTTGAMTYGPALLAPVVAAVLVGVTLLLG